MSTSLATLRQLLAADIGDVIFGSCASTTTSNGTAGGSTIVDSSLMALPNDWIRTGTGGEPQSVILITSGTYSGEIRFASAFTNASGTITVSSAFTGQILSGVTYEIHRFGHPTLKEWAIQQACYEAFPDVYLEVDSEAYHFGNWLIDGHFETWTSATELTYWTKVTTTTTKTTSPTFGGDYACTLSAANGYIHQDSTTNKDLLMLGGSTPTFSARVKASTASQVRLAIYDGTSFNYSDYHTGGGGWELLTTTPTSPLADSLATLSFRIYLTGFATSPIIDNAGVVAVAPKYNYDISALGLAGDCPNMVYTIEGQELDSDTYYPLNESIPCSYWKPLGDGKIQFTRSYADGTKLRIVGMKYVTQPTSTVSTEPEAPQTGIISAIAASKLFNSLAQTGPSNSAATYQNLASYWESESQKRRKRFGLKKLPISRTW